MSAKYTFKTATDFKNFLRANHENAQELFRVFVELQAKFHDDKIIAHNICVLAAQGEKPYMIAEILNYEYASV